MIESLRIRNLAVVEEAEVDFVPGFNVLTGETGAGKSLILGALALLTGGRASAGAVRSGSKRASVEAVLHTAALPSLERELAAQGIAVEDHAVVVSRSVSSEGRSRAQIGGQWVPVSALRDLFEGRLEISSQHASQSLRRREEHAHFLDDFGGLAELAQKVRESFRALRGHREELAALRAAQAERERQRDFLRFQCEEIDDAAIAPGEIAALDDEQRRLAHAEELQRGRHAASAALSGDDSDVGGALAGVERAIAESEALLRVDPQLGSLVDRLRAAREELADVALELVRGADRTEVDPARLEVVEARIALIEAMRRKYGSDEAAIAAQRERIARELEALGEDAGRVEVLDAACAQGTRELEASAKELSAARERAAAALAAEVEQALGRLDMAGARFEVALEPAPAPDGFPCSAQGSEHVEFRLGANAGEPARPLAKVASGGELSRVFLALMKARLRGGAGGSGSGRMMVFDEVDTGIGGRAIDQVGALLEELGSQHQVFCITHWPQIAAAASGHHRVLKTRRGGRTRTAVEAIDDVARVEEIARMAGGAKVTAATRRHARDLLRKRVARRSAAQPSETARSPRQDPAGPAAR